MVRVTDDLIEIREKVKDLVVVNTYPAHDYLAAGKVQSGAPDNYAYRLQDVKKGDVVRIGVLTESEKMYCAEICIRERPGGNIPASQRPTENKPYHLKRQAQLDEEQKGVSIPQNLRSPFAGMTAQEVIRLLDEVRPAEKKDDPKKDDKK